MKNINKIMFVSIMMMTIGSLSAFGGNRMGADPDTFTPGRANQNYFRFTTDNLSQSIQEILTESVKFNGEPIDISNLYGKYYPLLQQLSLKTIDDNAFVCKFENVIITPSSTAPSGTQLIGTFILPNQGASFAEMMVYVFGVLVQ